MAVPKLFAARAADPKLVERLIEDTGSSIDAEGLKLYRRLARNPYHVAAALKMMANWELRPLEYRLRRISAPLVLIVGEGDRTIPPANAARVRVLVPSARVVSLPGLGHLAHEERPQKLAELITGLARSLGVLAA
jgi:magnesium chelatase accessory protein